MYHTVSIVKKGHDKHEWNRVSRIAYLVTRINYKQKIMSLKK